MIRGLVILSSVSFIFAAAGYLLGSSPIAWFLIGIVIQVIFNYALNMTLKTWGQINTNRLKVERMNAISKNLVNLECANCRVKTETEILLSEPKNSFTCKNCGKNNAVFVSIETANQTVIPDNNLLTSEVIKNIESKQGEGIFDDE